MKRVNKIFTVLAVVASAVMFFSFTYKDDFDTLIKFRDDSSFYVRQTDLVFDQTKGDFNEGAIATKNANTIVICPGTGENCLVVVVNGMDNTTVYYAKKTVGGPDFAVYQ